MRTQGSRGSVRKLAAGVLPALAFWFGAQGAMAQTAPAAGEVLFSKGVGFAQQPGQNARTLGKGLPLQPGDTLSTAADATAIVQLQDGTKLTLRPGTELQLEQYQYRAGASDNSMVMQLLRGGLRAITGLISKGSPNAARIKTPTATIGIRGTDFDARLCTSDCAQEDARHPERPRQMSIGASAKLAQIQGEMTARRANGEARRVVEGGGLFPGDTVETAPGTRAVVVFRDNSRVTLGPQTQLRVDDFVFDDRNPSDGRFLVSLLRGTARALTGLIGKANQRNVAFKTPTATIGIRGTGLDMACGDAECSYFVWQGQIEVTPTQGAGGQPGSAIVLSEGEGVRLGPQGQAPQGESPIPSLVRPDGVTIDLGPLFEMIEPYLGESGLFVVVREGHIELTTATGVLQLGPGEVGRVNPQQLLARVQSVPPSADFDGIPKPDVKNPLLFLILGESGVRTSEQCK